MPDSTICYIPLCAEYAAGAAAVAATGPDPWTLADLQPELLDPSLYPAFVALQGTQVVGILCFLRQDTQSAYLRMLAVAPTARRQGIGIGLMRHALEALRQSGVRNVTLEVRCSNTGAVALYQQLGFTVVIRRARLYTSPVEDGFAMELAL